MPMYDIGDKGYVQGSAVATLSYSPLSDRAGIVTRILIDKVSAGDVWIVSTQGREQTRFDIQTTGNQQPLSGPYSGYPKTNDWFAVVADVLGQPVHYPVPMGQTITISSVGGATAQIQIEYLEVSNAEVSPGMVNHPQGSRFVVPLVLYRSGTTSATGEVTLDTTVGPNWFPNIAVDGNIPPNWNIRVLAIFLEGAGRNTFSGSADHQSNTTYFAVIRNGQRLYTRAALGGIPLIGQASATGSANTVVGTDATPKPPLQETNWYNSAFFTVPLVLTDGASYMFRLNIAGDVTGGATYAAARQLFICDVRTGGIG